MEIRTIEKISMEKPNFFGKHNFDSTSCSEKNFSNKVRGICEKKRLFKYFIGKQKSRYDTKFVRRRKPWGSYGAENKLENVSFIVSSADLRHVTRSLHTTIR